MRFGRKASGDNEIRQTAWYPDWLVLARMVEEEVFPYIKSLKAKQSLEALKANMSSEDLQTLLKSLQAE